MSNTLKIMIRYIKVVIFKKTLRFVNKSEGKEGVVVFITGRFQTLITFFLLEILKTVSFYVTM